jgi:membrane-bound metal-dependent hydrolase YbcI (DUF457 family)
MVDVSGHVAIALLFAVPAWFVWGRRGSLTFVGFTLVTAMLPDVDLFLRYLLPTIQHHGVTHTLFFASCASVVGGAAVAKCLTDEPNAHAWVHIESISRETVFVFAGGAFLLGGTAHVFGDLLSAPDVAAPLEPLWPFYRETIVIDAIYYDSPIWNFGLLAVAIALHAAPYRWEKYPIESAYRIGGDRSPSLSPSGSDEER